MVAGRTGDTGHRAFPGTPPGETCSVRSLRAADDPHFIDFPYSNASQNLGELQSTFGKVLKEPELLENI